MLFQGLAGRELGRGVQGRGAAGVQGAGRWPREGWGEGNCRTCSRHPVPGQRPEGHSPSLAHSCGHSFLTHCELEAMSLLSFGFGFSDSVQLHFVKSPAARSPVGLPERFQDLSAPVQAILRSRSAFQTMKCDFP